VSHTKRKSRFFTAMEEKENEGTGSIICQVGMRIEGGKPFVF
jgi:hypothetical protein